MASHLDLRVEHRDGVAWHAAPAPFWFHRCTPQTTGYSILDLPEVERCACGGLRYGGFGPWIFKNSKRAQDIKDRLRGVR
jgi:hypothetical protein